MQIREMPKSNFPKGCMFIFLSSILPPFYGLGEQKGGLKMRLIFGLLLLGGGALLL